MGRKNKRTSNQNEWKTLKQLNEMEITKLSDKEFKLMVIKMLKELTDNYRELNENYNSMKKEIEIINANQEEMNHKL